MLLEGELIFKLERMEFGFKSEILLWMGSSDFKCSRSEDLIAFKYFIWFAPPFLLDGFYNLALVHCFWRIGTLSIGFASVLALCFTFSLLVLFWRFLLSIRALWMGIGTLAI